MTCEHFFFAFPYAGSPWAHILNTAVSRAIESTANHEVRLVTFKCKDVKNKLQFCITWTKKSGKGAKTWKKSCITAALVLKKGLLACKRRDLGASSSCWIEFWSTERLLPSVTDSHKKSISSFEIPARLNGTSRRVYWSALCPLRILVPSIRLRNRGSFPTIFQAVYRFTSGSI